MAKPNTFLPGTTAESGKVNENFDYVDGVIGSTSTASEFKPPKRIVLGPRRNMAINPERDTTTDANSFLEVGWNAESYYTGGQWKLRRYLNNNSAGLWRLGKDGFDIYGTEKTTGDLDAQKIGRAHV